MFAYFFFDFYSLQILVFLCFHILETMETKKQGKKQGKFFCEKCNFVCIYISEYNRHLLTAKHLMETMETKKQEKNKKAYMCCCGKKYTTRSGLWKHKKMCDTDENNLENVLVDHTNDNSTILNLISQNNELMNLLVVQKEETKELIEQNKKMQQTIQEIVPKIGNNNTTNNNHFNLNVFLNEDCKDAINFSEFIENIKISFEDLERQAEIGYINGVSKLFIENLQELGTNKRPIHCTDKKRKTLYIKENDEWNKEGSQNTLKKGIQEVSRKNLECLIQEKERNIEEYNDIESEFSEKCLHIQRNILPGVPRETSIGKVIEKISQKSGIIE